jgi:hypothetical protein
MITLDHPNKKLQVVLSGAVNTNELPINVGFKEISSVGESQRATDGITTGGTAVDVLQGSAGLRRLIQAMSIYNADLAAVTVTVRLYNATGTTRVITTVILQTLETLMYDEESGFYCLDVNGNRKTNASGTSGVTSTADSKAVQASSQISSYAAVAGVPASVASTSSQASSIAAAIVPASINSVSSAASSHIAAVVPASVNSVSSAVSALSTASQTATTWSTVSSAASRVKSSFSW